MIRPLRTAHCRMFVGLAVLLPTILVAGIRARQNPAPRVSSADVPPPGRLISSSDNLWAKHRIKSEFHRDPKTNLDYVVLKPFNAFDEPDLLLYWSDDAPANGALSTNSKLIGSVGAGQYLALPASADHGGYLILFSLARNQIVDVATVEKLA